MIQSRVGAAMISRRFFLTGSTLVMLMAKPNNLLGQTLIDLWESSVSQRFFIDISARCGNPGHTFVRAGVELDNGLVWYQAIFGLYPAGGGLEAVKSVVQNVPGQVTSKWDDIARPDVSFERTVERALFDRVMGLYREWLSDAPQYSLLGNNCSVFASEVAKLVGMTLPSADPSSTLPCSYVASLVTANR